jgi:hypothetical protein
MDFKNDKLLEKYREVAEGDIISAASDVFCIGITTSWKKWLTITQKGILTKCQKFFPWYILIWYGIKTNTDIKIGKLFDIGESPLGLGLSSCIAKCSLYLAIPLDI